MFDDDELRTIERESKRRIERVVSRAREQDSRTRILAMLGEDGGAELTEEQIATRLPGKRRGNVRQARYHLDILHTAGLVLHDGGDPALYRLA